MQITAVILLGICLQVAAKTVSQTITFSGKDVPMEKILLEVKNQSGFFVSYNTKQIRSLKPVTITAKDLPLTQFLETAFTDQSLEYVIKENTIFIRQKTGPPAADLIPQLPPPIKISGTVTGLNNQLLAGATITVKGMNITTVTDENGYFELNAEAGSILVITYVGFQQREYKVNNGEAVWISLIQMDSRMDTAEVIVSTGYQEMSFGKVTGSVVKINNELFNRQIGSNILERIYGITSGLINDPSGQSGGRQDIVIRGKATINGSYKPLIVVDNFPYEGNIESLNPNDVESVTVLKDAAAAAVWGARAGNGVIVVTTKKGRYEKKISVGLNANYTVSEKPDIFYIPLADSKEFIEYETSLFSKGVYNVYDDFFPGIGYFPVLPIVPEILLKARRQGIAEPLMDPGVLSMLEEYGKNDVRNDVYRYLTRRANLQQYSVNFSGGTERFAFYGSIGYDGERGENQRSKNNRLTFTANSSMKITRKLELFAQMVHARNNSNSGGSPFMNYVGANRISPYTKLVDFNGEPISIPNTYRTPYIDTASYPALFDWHFFPLKELNAVKGENNTYSTRLRSVLSYKIFNWLQAEMQYQSELSIIQSSLNNTINSFYVRDGINKTMNFSDRGVLVYPWPLGDVYNTNHGNSKSWNLRWNLNVDKKWNNTRLSGIAGLEYREFLTDLRSNIQYGYDPLLYTYQYVNPLQEIPSRPSGATVLPQAPNPVGTVSRFGSLFTEVQYSLFDKFVISASGRLDQSNSYGVKTNMRKVPLWSVGANWLISEEKWYGLRWLPLLRAKLSYGYTGNTQGATSYAIMSSMDRDFYVPNRGNVIGGEITTPNNPGLRWERVKILNTGVDFSLLNNKFNGSLEYYLKRSVDLIGGVKTDPTTGFTSYLSNNASMLGQGIDLTIRTNFLNIQNVSWTSTLLISFNKTKVLKYYSGVNLVAYGVLGGAGDAIEGYPLNSIFSVKSAGLDPQTGDPRIYLGDTISLYSSLNKANFTDLIYNGPREPKYFGSFMNDFKWRSLIFSFNVTYQFGAYFRRNSLNYSALLGGNWNAHSDLAKRWKQKGDETRTNVPSLPEFADGFRDYAYLYSDKLIEKSDNVRLSDIRVSYVATSNFLKKIKLKSVTIYGYVKNVGILWRKNSSGIDPLAYTDLSYPPIRSYAIGISFSY